MRAAVLGLAYLAGAHVLPAVARAQAPAGAAEVVAVEWAFAARVLEGGTKAGFTEYLAPDGVVFRPGPVNGLELWAARPAGAGVLAWRPALAGISAAGDLGFSTGPFEARSAPAAPVAGTGWYLSIWRRQPDGQLRLLADHGLAAAAATGPAAADSGIILLAPGKAGPNPPVSLAALDSTAALPPAHPGVRTMAAGTLHVGPSARAALFASARPVLAPSGSGVAGSGDLGYTYGAYTWGTERGFYLRVWRLEGERWEVVADVFSPTR